MAWSERSTVRGHGRPAGQPGHHVIRKAGRQRGMGHYFRSSHRGVMPRAPRRAFEPLDRLPCGRRQPFCRTPAVPRRGGARAGGGRLAVLARRWRSRRPHPAAALLPRTPAPVPALDFSDELSVARRGGSLRARGPTHLIINAAGCCTGRASRPRNSWAICTRRSCWPPPGQHLRAGAVGATSACCWRRNSVMALPSHCQGSIMTTAWVAGTATAASKVGARHAEEDRRH